MGGQDTEALFSEIKKLPKEDKKKLIAVMLLTDGYLGVINGYPKLAYYGLDKILHKIFRYLINSTYATRETSFYWRNSDTDYRRKEHSKIYEDMLTLSPGFDSKSKEATISFLFNSSRNVKKLAIQLAMGAEGSISISRRDTGTIRGDLALACISKRMCEEWKQLFEEFGINMKIKKNQLTSTGIHGVQAIQHDSICRFYEEISFISGNYANRARRFKGKEKQEILKLYYRFIQNLKKERFKMYTRWSNNAFWEAIRAGGQSNFSQKQE